MPHRPDLPTSTRGWVLTQRPAPRPSPTDVTLTDLPLPELQDGQVLIRNTHLAVLPSMLGLMRPDTLAQRLGVQGPLNPHSRFVPYTVGEPMTGPALGEVLASRAEGFRPGDTVRHLLGWRKHALAPAKNVEKLDTGGLPPAVFLGALGLNGLAAYAGLTQAAQLREGDIVFISSAGGAVGSLAGQIARLKGASRVIGSAGTPEKCQHLVKEFGYDATLLHPEGNLTAQLRQAAPDGIDVYFDNVGGDHLEAALECMRRHGRIALSGMLSLYLGDREPGLPNNAIAAIGKSLTLTGFHVFDHLDHVPGFAQDVPHWIANGQLTCPQTLFEGLDRAHEAFLALFDGHTTGQPLVQL
ncbi:MULTISPECIES: NADP-dependent oxidoreductase [Streptomyces]|uniref:NADP-dependent oxidoreductase n=1 Tax=Streptomyces TaxID=1883 RepID=UPI0004CCB739|nr:MULTISPECIES: NADP-dependent oxidoreductase [Streptomyces]KOT65822.1 hypothetical protein ADK43_02550 [Streptomyces rimosus subsp. rimosus]